MFIKYQPHHPYTTLSTAETVKRLTKKTRPTRIDRLNWKRRGCCNVYIFHPSNIRRFCDQLFFFGQVVSHLSLLNAMNEEHGPASRFLRCQFDNTAIDRPSNRTENYVRTYLFSILPLFFCLSQRLNPKRSFGGVASCHLLGEMWSLLKFNRMMMLHHMLPMLKQTNIEIIWRTPISELLNEDRLYIVMKIKYKLCMRGKFESKRLIIRKEQHETTRLVTLSIV